MSRTESQLEVYKIVLGRKTTRQIIEEKEVLEAGAVGDAELFVKLFTRLLGKLTQGVVWTSNNNPIGLALLSNAGEDVNRVLSCHSDSTCIEGFIDGGPYNKIRTVAQTTDVTQRERLGKDKMVSERFYVYLYLPLGAKVGLLLLEKKGNSNIGSAIRKLVEELLKTPRFAVKIERFVPQAMIDEYKNGSVVETLTFSDQITTSVIDVNGVEPEEKHYRVTLTITPPEGDRTGFDDINRMLNSISSGAVHLGDAIKNFIDFSSKKGSLKKEDKKYSFVIGEDLKIRPMIPLDDELQDEDSGTLKRAEIKAMCDELIEQVQDEVYPVL